jgi:cytochrome P450
MSTTFTPAWALTSCRAILHDPAIFPEPDSFKPERFINPDGSLRDDPVVSTIFGIGKRICPGRHLAEAMMFIVIASFLCVFDIKKGMKGNDTNGGPDTYPYTGTAVRCDHRVPLM